MGTIGVGLVGTGFMGKCHALAWAAVRATFGDTAAPRLEILCDRDPALAEKRAAEWGFARWTADWRAVVDDPAVQAVSITVPNDLHRDIAVAALAAGKHVWCEKPMALTLADAEAMAAAAAAAGTTTLLGYNYIRNPAVGHARRLIESGAIGEVIHFRGQVDEDYMASPDVPWSWRCRVATGGLGTLGDITCHLVSFAHTLVGEIESLSADMETVHRTRPMPGSAERRAVENEDIAHAVVRFRSGVSGVLASSRTAWGRKNLIRVEVHGTNGMLVFDQERLNELQLFVAEGPEAMRGFRTILIGPVHPPYGRFNPAPGHQLGFNELKVIEAAEFLQAVAGGGEPWLSFSDGLKIERVVHAMARSARQRRWTSVDEGNDGHG